MTPHTPSTQATKRKPKSATTRLERSVDITNSSGVRILIVDTEQGSSFPQITELPPPISGSVMEILASQGVLNRAIPIPMLHRLQMQQHREMQSLAVGGAPSNIDLEKGLAKILAEVERLSRSMLPIHGATFRSIGEPRLSAQHLIDKSPIRRLDPVDERLQQRTVDAVLNGTAWLSSKEVGTRADAKAANKHALASRLLKEGRVFAIERGGHKEFPLYAFDQLGNPIPAMREVLRILSGYSPFRLASWFESSSARLGGHRPREVLATDPQAVIEAARAQLTGPVHG